MKKIAVITGASGGLGKEFVRQVINEVDEVWAIGRNVAKLEGLRAEFGETNSNGGEGRRGAAGSKIIPLQMDLSDTKSYDLLSGRLESEGGASAVEISWLINNAGAGRFAPSTDFSTEELAGFDFVAESASPEPLDEELSSPKKLFPSPRPRPFPKPKNQRRKSIKRRRIAPRPIFIPPPFFSFLSSFLFEL